MGQTTEWITIDEALAAAGISRREIYKRMKPGDPNFIISQDRKVFDGKRGKMVHAGSLSPAARDRLLKKALTEIQTAATGKDEAPILDVETRGQLSLLPKTEIDAQIQNIPPGVGRDLAVKRFRVILPLVNHDWKVLGYRTDSGYISHTARTVGVSPRTVLRWLEKYLAQKDIAALADRPSGPPPGTGTVLDASMQSYVTDCWAIQKLTKMQTYRKLNGYLRDKQRGVGTSWSYVTDGEGKDFVSRDAVTRYIDKHLGGENNRWRRGGTGIKDAAGYIDRRYDECAGDAWCIDEKDGDGIFYLPKIHTWTTRPYMLSIIDERTTRILARKLVLTDDAKDYPKLDSDAVLDLLEETVRTYGRPKFLVRDKGGHFRSKVGGRMMARNHGELVEKAIGALGKLGVEVRSPGREKNPRANRIERLHRIYSDLARRDFGISFCGANLKERECPGIDERIARHKREHCQEGTCGPQLLSFDDAEHITAGWMDEINRAETTAKGCDGMTRLAAFNAFQPPEAERAARIVSDAELLAAFSEDYEVTVQTGGVIAIPGKPFPIRYSHALLILPEFKGKKLRVTRARHDKSVVLVYASPGEAPIRADRRVAVGVQNKDDLARESAKLARTRKVLEQSSRPVIDLSGGWEAVNDKAEEMVIHPAEKFALSESEPVHPEIAGLGFADLE